MMYTTIRPTVLRYQFLEGARREKQPWIPTFCLFALQRQCYCKRVHNLMNYIEPLLDDICIMFNNHPIIDGPLLELDCT